jgi:two-component system response regulator FixJ
VDGEDPTSFQHELRVRGCAYPVIAITADSDVVAAVRAMKAGACDVITLPLRRDDVREAVTAALALLSRSQAAESSVVEMRNRVESLTRREAQVLDAMLRGAANKAIAHELGISPRTVEVHRAKVMGKLACRSLPELVHIAVRLGIARS